MVKCMYIKSEVNLANFNFWSGALYNSRLLKLDELEQLEDILETKIFFDRVPTDGDINDLFWFNFGYICKLIGLEWNEDEGIIVR